MRKIVLFVLFVLFLFSTAPVLAQVYDVSGTVFVDDGSTIVPAANGISLRVYDPAGGIVANTAIGAAGTWTVSLPGGDYLFHARPSIVGNYDQYVSEFNDGTHCIDGNCSGGWTSALAANHTPVSVNGSTGPVDITLEQGVVVFGKITDENTGEPIRFAYAYVTTTSHSVDDWRFVYGAFEFAYGETGIDGNYIIPAFPAREGYLYLHGDNGSYGHEVGDNIKCLRDGPNGCDAADAAVVPIAVIPGDRVEFDLDLVRRVAFSGNVSENGGGPIGGAEVNLRVAADSYVAATVYTDGNGDWYTDYIAPGSYYVTARGQDHGLVGQVYNAGGSLDCPLQWCNYAILGTELINDDGLDRSNIDFTLNPQMPASISGTVLNTNGENPGGAVQLFDPFGNHVGDFWTDGEGNWGTHPLADGLYYAKTKYTGNTIDDEWDGADGSPCQNDLCNVLESTPIEITGGLDVTGINFILDDIPGGGVISGNLQDGSGNPVAYSAVAFMNSQGQYLGEVKADLNGNYSSSLLANDDYYVRSHWEPNGLQRKLWDDVTCVPEEVCHDGAFVTTNGTIVTITNNNQPGIDFVLGQPATGHTISGTVLDDQNGTPLAEVTLSLLDESGNQIREVLTNSEGEYFFSGLENANYKVYANGVPSGYDMELFEDVACPNWSCDFNLQGTLIEILDADSADNDITLPYIGGTRLTGKVTRNDSGDAVSSRIGYFGVDLFDSNGDYVGSADTNIAGQYQFVMNNYGLLPGDYYLATAQDRNYHGLLMENWTAAGDGLCDMVIDCQPLDGDLITIADGATVTADFVLGAAATIIGTIVDAADGVTPVHPIYISLIDPISGADIGGATNNPDGSYEIAGTTPGEYKFLFNAVDGANHYIDELYDEITPCDDGGCDRANLGDTLVLTSGSNTLNEELVQKMPASISGTVLNTNGENPGGTVQMFNQLGDHVGDFWLDGEGNWGTHPLDDGLYYAKTQYTGNVIDGVWDGVDGASCQNSVCDVLASTPIEITGGLDVSGINFVLDIIQGGGVISGNLQDGSGNPVAYSAVAFMNSQGQYISEVQTDPNGNYSSSLLANDDYYVRTHWEPNGLQRKLWDDVICVPEYICHDGAFVTSNGSIVTIANNNQSGIDFVLDQPVTGHTISGAVLDDQSATPLAQVQLFLMDEFGNQLREVMTNANGDYFFSGLENGNYKVYANGPPVGYDMELFEDVACPNWSCDFNGEGTVIGVLDADSVGNDITLPYVGGTRFHGTVSSDVDGPVSSRVGYMAVGLYNSAGYITETSTNIAGQYQLILSDYGVGEGDYYLVTYNDQSYHGLINEDQNGTQCFQDCDPLNFSSSTIFISDGSSEQVDFNLAPAVQIRGRVTNGVDPIAYVQLDVWDADRNYVGSANTDSNGDFRYSPPGNGSYTMFIPYYGVPSPYLPEVWDGVDGTYCNFDVCDVQAVGTPIQISGSSVDGIDFVLDAGFTISGQLADANNGNPIEGVSICVHRTDGSFTGLCAETDDQGNYQTFPLPAGSDYSPYALPDDQGYQRQLYNGLDCPSGNCDFSIGTPVELGNPGDAIGIDFYVNVGATISGNITGLDTGLGIESIELWLFDLDCNWRSSGTSDSNGDYEIPVSTPGNFYLFANANDTWDLDLKTSYINQQYPGINMHDTCYPPNNDVTLGEVIGVGEGENVVGKDFVLEPGGSITGTISDANGVLANDTAVARLYRASDGASQKNSINKESDGSYHMGGLIPGTYHVVLTGYGLGLIDERFADEHCPRNSCDPVLGDELEVVTGLEVFTGINAVLEAGAVIRGHLSDAQSGLPVADYCVYIYNEAGIYAALACGDANGDFESIGGLPDGNYRLSNQLNNNNYQPVTRGYIPQVWTSDNSFLACGEECDFLMGDTFTVSGTNPVENIDMAMSMDMPADATISGTVTNTNGENPGGAVQLFDTFGNHVGDFWLDGAGNWSTGPMPGGLYYATTKYTQNVIDDVWDGIDGSPCQNNLCNMLTGTPIEITGGLDVSGINFILDLIPGGGFIGGNVQDGSGNPVANAAVAILNSKGEYLREMRTEPNGIYVSPLMANDDYYLRTEWEPNGLQRKLWDDVICAPQGLCDEEVFLTTNGSIVSIANNDQPGIDFVLDQPATGHTISGAVLDDQTSRPLAEALVLLMDEFGGHIRQSRTNSNGDYYFSGLENGNYKVYVNGPPNGYDMELFQGVPCADWSCDFGAEGTVIVILDADSSGNDFTLPYIGGSRIFGTVTRSDNGDPASSNFGYMAVNLFDDAGNHIGETGTDSAGNYQFQLPGGTASYYLATNHDTQYHDLLDECWDDIKCFDNYDPIGQGATLIPVADGTTVIADFVLDSPLRISGRVTDGVNPIYPVRMDVQDTNGNFLGSTFTDDNGDYSIPVPGDGDYIVYMEHYAAPSPYLPEVWDGIDGTYCNTQLCDVQTSGTPIQVTGSSVTGIDFVLDAGFTISGSVRDATTTNPVEGPYICVHISSGAWTGICGQADSQGNYETEPLLAGSDYVAYVIPDEQGYRRQMYDGLDCPTGNCDFYLGTPIEVGNPGSVGGVDFNINVNLPAAGGSISGFVKDVTTDTGIGDIWMWLLDESCTQVAGVDAYTDSGEQLGQYTIYGVPDGIYYLMAVGELQGYINELYPNEKRMNPCGGGEFPVGQAIVIDNENQVENIDFALDAGGLISGVISDSNGKMPYGQSHMRLYDAEGVLIATVGDWAPNWTPDVTYVIDGVIPGDYQVVFTSNYMGLIDERFDDAPCPRNSCDPLLGNWVSVGPGEHVTGIDGELAPGAIIRGRVTDAVSGDGVAYMNLAIYNAEGIYAGYGFTDEDGYYESNAGFPDGNYYLSSQYPSHLSANKDLQGYLPQVWTNDGSFGACGEPCDVRLGDTIAVSGLSPVENVNLAMETGTNISGMVSTGGSTALSNITLQLRSSADGSVIRSVFSDGSGAYQFSGVGSGTYFIRTLNTQGFGDLLHAGISCNPFCDPLTGTPLNADGNSDISGVSFDLSITPAIAGVVKDESSTPVAGVKVQAFDVLGTLIATASSNVAGEYLLNNLYAGNFYVKTANTAGFVDDLWTSISCLPGCNPTLGTQISVGASGTVSDINLNLGSSSKLQGTVSTGANPLGGVTIQVYSAAGALVGSSVSSATGSYSVSGLSAGNYHAVTRNIFGYINEGAGGSVCQPATCAPTSTAVVSVGVNQTEVRNFDLDLGAVVNGTVKNSAAVPLQGVTVSAYNSSGVLVGSASSGSSGNYSIKGLAGPVVYLRTSNSLGYKNQRYNGLECGSTCNVLAGTFVAVVAGSNVNGINFALVQGSAISGVVRNTSSAPLANVQIQVSDALSGVLTGYALSGPAGTYTVAGLPAGNYRLKAISSSGYIDRMRGGDNCSPEPCGFATGTATNVASTNVSGVDITLSLGGSISGVVTTEQAAPLPPVPLPLGTAWIYSDTGQLVKQGGIFNGSFFVNGLANGTYHMVVTNSSGLVDQLWQTMPCLQGSCDVTLGADIVVSGAEAGLVAGFSSGAANGGVVSSQLNFSLDKGYRISGTLKHGVTPIASTKVYFFDAEGKPAGEATSNGLGEFTLDSGLPNGSYFVATSRAAKPEDTPEEAADAINGAVAGLTDEIYSGFSCVGVCAPSLDLGVGTPIVVDGADIDGIDIVLSVAPGISLEKHTNGVDADTPDGGEAPEIAIGAAVSWTYKVTNTGGFDLENVVVIDNPVVAINCPSNSLAVGITMTCTASGVAQDLGSGGIAGNCSGRPNSRLFQNSATVTAETSEDVPVTDDDMSHYCNPVGPISDVIFQNSFE